MEFLTALPQFDLVMIIYMCVYGLALGVKNVTFRIISILYGGSINQSDAGFFLDIVWTISVIYFLIKYFK